MKQPCCAVSYTWCNKNGHIPGGPLWMVTWLPRGYDVVGSLAWIYEPSTPSLADRLICTFFDTEHAWDEFCPKNPPPLIKAVCKAIEDHLRDHPDDVAGHLV